MNSVRNLAAAAALGAAFPAHGAVLVQNQFADLSSSTVFPGQSFVLPAGSYDHIAFNFYASPSTPVAAGKLWLYSAPFAGTPSTLSMTSSWIGYGVAANGVFGFDPGLTLTGGQPLYAYDDTAVASVRYAGVNSYPDGTGLGSIGSVYTGQFTTVDLQFLVTGTPTAASVSEPAAWPLLVLGLGSVALRRAARRRPALCPSPAPAS